MLMLNSVQLHDSLSQVFKSGKMFKDIATLADVQFLFFILDKLSSFVCSNLPGNLAHVDDLCWTKQQHVTSYVLKFCQILQLAIAVFGESLRNFPQSVCTQSPDWLHKLIKNIFLRRQLCEQRISAFVPVVISKRRTYHKGVHI